MPLKSQITNDRLLANISVAYRNSDYIAENVAQMVPVKKTSDIYYVYDRDFRIPETLRADKALAREYSFDVSTASYNLEIHALKDYISEDEMDNFEVGDLRADVTEALTDKIMARKEKSLATLLFTTSSFSLGVSLAAGADFDANTTTSNPIPVFDTGCTTVIANSGLKPNWAIIPRSSFIAIKNHTSVLDRTKYTSKEMTKEILAGLLDLQTIHCPTAVEDTAAKGITSSIGGIWAEDFCLLGYSPARPGLKTPATVYKFAKKGRVVRRWVDEERRNAEAIEVEDQFQFRVVASLTGYYIKDTL